MDTLLQDSREHFRKRMLKKALVAAQIALDFARKEGSPEDVFTTCILLARIFSVNARYAMNGLFYKKAEAFLEEAESLNWVPEPEFKVRLLHAKADIKGFQVKVNEASEDLNLALAIAQKNILKEEEIKLLVSYAYLEMTAGNYEHSMQLSDQALDTFREFFDYEKNKSLAAEVYTQMAQVLVKKADYYHALEFGQLLLSISRELNDTEKEINALMVMAIVSATKANYKIAMQYFQEALVKSQNIGYQQSTVDCLINMATIYAHLYNYDDALARYNEVLENYRSQLDDASLIAIYNNVGNIYASKEEPDVAHPYFEKALILAEKNNLVPEASLAKAHLSRVCTAQGEIRKATELALEAAKSFNELGLINGSQINLLNLAELSYRQGDLDQAAELAMMGKEAAEKLLDDSSQIKAWQLLAAIFEKKGDFPKAHTYLKEFVKRSEAFSKMQLNRQFLDLEIKNALREKQKEIEQLTKENEYQALLLEKGDQIKKQNDELLQMNEDLKQFAYVASHDLKEPLRMIGSYAQIITRIYGDKLDDNAKTYFGYITEGVTRMNHLLDALLKYTTVGKSDEEFEELELNYIVDIVKVHLKVLIEESGAQITVDELPDVYSGKSLLILLMQNLLSNAIKFRKPDIPPQIHISASQNDEFVTVKVQDNGIGIAKEHLDRIFVIFQRLHARSEYEGTGIGLAICQRICQRLGGKIWVESEPGKGSSFYFSLPVHPLES
ncbi:MAG: ATP-binding protein [Saprospiraceae bacterium]